MNQLQEELIGCTIGLARACSNNPKTEDTDRIIIEGLYTATISNEDVAIQEMISKVKAEKHRIVPDCSVCKNPCGNTDDYDIQNIWNDKEETRALKTLILFGIQQLAVEAYQRLQMGNELTDVCMFFHKALCVISYDMKAESLMKVAMEIGNQNLAFTSL